MISDYIIWPVIVLLGCSLTGAWMFIQSILKRLHKIDVMIEVLQEHTFGLPCKQRVKPMGPYRTAPDGKCDMKPDCDACPDSSPAACQACHEEEEAHTRTKIDVRRGFPAAANKPKEGDELVWTPGPNTAEGVHEYHTVTDIYGEHAFSWQPEGPGRAREP